LALTTHRGIVLFPLWRGIHASSFWRGIHFIPRQTLVVLIEI
jgi:hypothetical protein